MGCAGGVGHQAEEDAAADEIQQAEGEENQLPAGEVGVVCVAEAKAK